MPFKKGQVTNPAGRPKGATNKISAEQRDYLRDYLLENKEKFEKEMKNMHGRSYVLTYLAMMQYILPKPATAELKEVPRLEEFIAMTREERQAAVNEIQETMKNQKQ
jgi:hypothetical protein